MQFEGAVAVSLLQLEDEWSKYEPAGQRPRGGRRALAGFNYQLSLSLATFFDAVERGDPQAAHAFEGLSDIAELREGLLYVTQVKLTLTSQRLADAHREFLLVDRFLEERFPSIREQVRYRVVTRTKAVRDLTQFSAQDLGLEGADIARWDSLQLRLEPPEVRGDPSFELAVKLWGTVSRPLAFVSSLRGLLVEHLASHSNSRGIHDVLLDRLERERVAAPPPGALLRPSDFEDRAEGETEVLVGRRPVPDDLARGCFMEREARVRPVLEAIRSVFDFGDGLASGSRKVPIIWIAGGAGAGKSAVLLQTVARWLAESDTPVHSLRHFVSQLPEALEFWVRQGQNAVIAVDDLFAPEFRGGELWREIHEAAAVQQPVVILTCGPTDYLEAFRLQENRHEVFDLRAVELPLLDSEEQARFADWFQTRTGRPGRTPVAESNFVVAAFLLERQRHGDADLAQFAARLHERLVAMDVLEVFLVALAANRLGVRAPMKLFEGRRDAMTRFLEEGLCQVSKLPEENEAVLWFHAALANAIYQQLVGADEVERRGHDITRFFESVVDDGPSAKAFLSLLIKGKNPRLDKRVAEAALREIGRGLAARQPPELRIGLMVLWEDGATKRGIAVKEILSRERIRAWMSSPELDAHGWGLLFQLLWPRLAQDEKGSFARKGLKWLAENLDSGAWSFVWRLVWSLRRFDQVSIVLARTWIDAHATEKGWGFVFQDLFRAGLREPWLREALVKGLRETPFSSADRYLWRQAEELGVAPESLLPLLTRRLLHCPIEYIQREGLERVATLTKEVGWIPAFEVLRGESESSTAPGLQDRAEWAHVWQRLLELEPESEELRAIGRVWLEGRKDRVEWTYVWRRLAGLAPDSEELRAIGRAWLAGREDRAQWAFMWQRLVELEPESDALRDIGRAWLGGREDRAEWNYVWRRLLELEPDSEELRAIGRAWLAGREDRAEWNYVWRRLLELEPDSEELRAIGRAWLAGREDQAQWAFMWQRLVELEPKSDALRDIGRAWLGGREDRAAWSHVWQRLLELEPESEELRAIGRAWLEGREDWAEWNYVWQRLVELNSDSEALLATGRAWLAGREGRVEWPYVWLVLWRSPDRELEKLGSLWLGRNSTHAKVGAVRWALSTSPL